MRQIGGLVAACKVTDSFFQKQRHVFIQNDDFFHTRKIFWYTPPFLTGKEVEGFFTWL